MKREDWSRLFSEAEWAHKVDAALKEICVSRDASPIDRQAACALWADLAYLKLVPGPKDSVEEMIVSVHADLLVLRPRDPDKAAQMHDLLEGCRAMITLALQVVVIPEKLAALKPGEKPGETAVPKLDLN